MKKIVTLAALLAMSSTAFAGFQDRPHFINQFFKFQLIQRFTHPFARKPTF
nr:MAG TPA: exopolysaccharide production protein [Bacteriophage sp.]